MTAAATPIPEGGTGEGGRDAVERALDGERSHEMRSTEADRPQRAELGLSLLGEHHEQVDHEQDPGGDAEPADGGEQLGHLGRFVGGVVEEVRLDGDHLGAGGDERIERFDHLVGAAGAVEHPTDIGDEHRGGGDRGRIVELAGDLAGADDDVAESVHAGCGTNGHDVERERVGPGEHLDLVAGGHAAEVVGEPIVDHRHAGSEPARVRSHDVRVAAERHRLGAVELDDPHTGLGRSGRRVVSRCFDRVDRGVVDSHRDVERDDVERAVDQRTGPLDDLCPCGSELVVILHDDQLVDGAPSVDGQPSDRRAERVADDERRGHERRGEERAEHDENRFAGAPEDAADREPTDRRPGDEVDDDGHEEHDGDDERDGGDHRTASSPTMRPSETVTIRSALAPIAGSWVTTTSVWPAALTSSNSSMTDSAVAESRLPVGSSAHTTAGSATSARAIATRCCSPPDSSAGR